MRREKRGFLESKLDSGASTPRTKAFVLCLIPYEETTTYKKGTALGPEAIVDASSHIELFDESLHIDPSSQGVLTLRPKVTGLTSVRSFASEAAASYGGSLLGFLGGEHSITPALVEGLGEGGIGIVWVDAHSDLRESYLGRSDNHACAARNSMRFGRIVQIGVRSFSEEEFDLLQRSDAVRAFRRWGDAAREAIRSLPPRVYLSIDVDGMDPSLVRAVGTPEPGGLSWEETLGVLSFVFKEKRVFAFDVVELCPAPDDVTSSYTVARLVYKVMAFHAAYGLAAGKPVR